MRSLAVLCLPFVIACSSTVDGTGSSGGSSSGGSSSGGSSPIGAPDDQASPPEAPAEIEALFTAHGEVTGGTLTGIWGSSGVSAEGRLKITSDTLTIARRCGSGAIAYATARIRLSQDKFTVLEQKTGEFPRGESLSTGCSTQAVQIEIGEWAQCTTDYVNCYTIDGTTMTGLRTSFSSSVEKWIKFSD